MASLCHWPILDPLLAESSVTIPLYFLQEEAAWRADKLKDKMAAEEQRRIQAEKEKEAQLEAKRQ